MARKLKASEVADYKEELMKAQGYKCPLCGGSLKMVKKINQVLDHAHDTGFCRAVVCRGCNGMEGKVKNLITTWGKAGDNPYYQRETLRRLLNYWDEHATPKTDVIYHKHKTAAEIREARNKKIRKTLTKGGK